MTRNKTGKKKLEVVFDPKKRIEFLTGFHKRKNERRKRAKDELEKNLKEERKRIRQEVRDGVKHMKKSFEPLRELTEEDKANEEEYEDDDVKVQIVELTTNELAAQNNLLGENRVKDSDDDEGSEEEDDVHDSNEEDDVNRIPGMDLEAKTIVKRKHTSQSTDETACKKPKTKTNAADLKDKKDIDRLKKNNTVKKIKKSKIFKMKERFEKTANQKRAKRDKNNTLRSIPKHLRKKKKFETSRYSKGRLLNRKQLRKKASAKE